MSKLMSFLTAANNGDFGFIDKMTDDDLKEISPFLLLGWFHGAQTNRESHVLLTDMWCNSEVFTLSKHPRLLLNLFISANCGFGRDRYQYIKSVSKKESKQVLAVSEYYRVSADEAKTYISILPEADLKKISDLMEQAK